MSDLAAEVAAEVAADDSANARPAVVEQDAAAREHVATFTIAADHPALAGHFPGNPMVPGVVLLDEAIASIESAMRITLGSYRVASVKFLQPVRPPATLTVRQRAGGSRGAPAIDFSIEDNSRQDNESRIVASGRIDALKPAR